MTWRNFNIKLKLLIVLLMLAAFFVVDFYLILLDFQKKSVEQLVASKIIVAQTSFKSKEDRDINMLSALIDVVAQDTAIKQLYAAKDREKLYVYIESLFKNFKEEHHITHWYFILPDGTVFLRVHDKTLYGDIVARKTFLAARDTKLMASGLELGKTAYALRTVMPYYDDGELIGYLEFGEEIDHFLTDLESETGDKFSALVDKSKLSHADWKSTREKVGLADNWDNYPSQLPVLSTPDSESTKNCLAGQKILNKRLVIGNQTFACAGFALLVAGGEPSGTIVSLINISEYARLVKNSNSKILILVIILLGIAFWTGLLIISAIVAPIRYLMQITKKIAEGDLTHRISVSSTDEIGQLATSFNEMEDKLLQLQQGLEEAVAKRTKELNSKTEELEKMNSLMIGRELKMIELKKEIEDLKKKFGSS